MDDHLTLPKGTERRIPLRPINSCIASPTSCAFKVLGFRTGTPYGWNWIFCFADFLRNQKVAKGELVVSFVVISLTSIPIHMTIDIVKRKLGRSNDWKKNTPSWPKLTVFPHSRGTLYLRYRVLHEISSQRDYRRAWNARSWGESIRNIAR